jgi:tRNA dimethylallyltransferase
MMISSSSKDQPENPALDCWFLTGPTASGKTTVAMAMADRLDAEIISLDSMAIYRGMDIGTAKPRQDERERIPHHLLDIVDPDQQYSVSEYVKAAIETIADIRGRGKEVLFVGGTPLYLKSLLRGLFEGPPADWDFRREIENEVAEVGLEALHERLRQVDPITADRLHTNDKRRMIRALEVYTLTGQPISHLQTQFEEEHEADACKVFVLSWPKELLHARIASRVDQMMNQGLVDEVRGLLDRYQQLSHTASQAVGYREVIEHLAGQHSLEESIELIKTRTRRFAKRQLTWFRSLTECRHIDVAESIDPHELSARMIESIEPRSV